MFDLPTRDGGGTIRVERWSLKLIRLSASGFGAILRLSYWIAILRIGGVPTTQFITVRIKCRILSINVTTIVNVVVSNSDLKNMVKYDLSSDISVSFTSVAISKCGWWMKGGLVFTYM